MKRHRNTTQMKEQTRNTKVQINEEKIGKLPDKVPNRINPRRNMPRHILIKLTKTKHKERILKAAREKQHITYKGNPICLTADLPAETLQARREWQDIFKVLKGKNLQPRLLYPVTFGFFSSVEFSFFF